MADVSSKEYSLDHYWRNIFSIKDYFGILKYENDQKIVHGVLVLARGSDDVAIRVS